MFTSQRKSEQSSLCSHFNPEPAAPDCGFIFRYTQDAQKGRLSASFLLSVIQLPARLRGGAQRLAMAAAMRSRPVLIMLRGMARLRRT